MFAKLIHKEKMVFESILGSHKITMDAKPPFGADSAPTPKQLLQAAISGCTAMDVVSLLKKHKQTFASLEIDSEASLTDGHPSVFKEVVLTYKITGDVHIDIAKEAVHLSLTKYCSVSAMISKACPILYKIELNGTLVAEGQAQFA
jgi:putative redox protein